MKYFNTEGSCNPKEHYMIKLDHRSNQIKKRLVDRRKYFVINKGRQYGKTTTLRALEEYLKNEYLVLSLDFQQIGSEDFSSEQTFSQAFAQRLYIEFRYTEVEDKETLQKMLFDFKKNYINSTLDELFICLSAICEVSLLPVVLMVDEVDSASNNQVFIDFLAQLRSYYLRRDKMPMFHSVILAGVYDIKNLKLKLRSESEHQYNSPWNIAANFNIDMNFSANQIGDMLKEYEADHHTGMDIDAIAEEIYAYTSGYPVLVSAICKYLDEDVLSENIWSLEGIEKAIKRILTENMPLFGSMVRHLDEYPSMRQMFHAILFQGSDFAYNPDTKEISIACMFGYAVDKKGKIQIANRIFEMRLYNYFLSEEELSSAIGNMAKRDKSYFIHDGKLDMDTTLKKFVEYFDEIYGDNDDKFVEAYGRKFFLLYLRPIINGIGNYYIEAQTRDARRTDVIVDYLGEQFIIELKIWHGNEYNERGERQLIDYLEYYHKDKGYMISFNFNKNKKIGVEEIRIGNKTIVEAVV